MMNKRAIAPVIGLILLAVAAFAAFSILGFDFDTASITGSGQYIERPVFKYIKCEAVSDLKYSLPAAIPDAGGWLSKPSVSSSYNVQVNTPKIGISGSVYTYWIKYAVCNSQVLSSIPGGNCRIPTKEEQISESAFTKSKLKEINGIRNNEYVYVKFEKGLLRPGDAGGATYQIGFVPYGLREYNILGGSAVQINPNSCEVSSSDASWKDRLLSTDVNKVDSQISKNTNERVLQPEEVRWYVAGYLTSAAPSFALTYNGKAAWCRPTGNSAEIYAINTISVGSGTYKVASADWSDNLGSETCCPGDKKGDETCNNKFQWIGTEKAECTSFNPCGGSEWTPYSEGQLTRYKCVSEKCVRVTKKVECASDYDCKDSNGVCDLNSYTCKNANVNLDGQVIKTVADNLADCQKSGGTWKKAQTEDKSLLNYIGIGHPRIIVTEFCEMPKGWFDYLKSAGGILIVLAVVVVLYFLRGYLFAIWNATIGRFF